MKTREWSANEAAAAGAIAWLDAHLSQAEARQREKFKQAMRDKHGDAWRWSI